ncbi:hypothetical protein GA830_10505 [Mesorhizobium sp. NBSH29]|uniref:hypothetical protein n=1 Tax=Mesorhizobium sp. NBSH29 TaxID=2654249 RepID=UPI0018968C54|nr:hypothetical protein [Mesorhizobium sp. NBSH29]QPC87125.1 hypothetical protein GA830_10505 [Mesorhizobium sp. NBSH29]
MWITAWALTRGRDDVEDFWVVGTEAEARVSYETALANPDLYAACLAPIGEATEFHWNERTENASGSADATASPPA